MQSTPRRKHKNPRAQISCVICHRRKVKCDAEKPCNQCTRRGQAAECVYAVPESARPSRRGASVESLPSDARTGHPGRDAEPRWPGADVEMVQLSEASPAATPHPSVISQALPAGDSVRTSSTGTLRSESRLPTQDWTRGGPVRGRSHSSWAVQLFEPLVAYLDENNSPGLRRKDEIPLLEMSYEQWRRKKLEARDMMISVRLSDELPAAALVRTLVARYFETLHTIFPVLDQGAFTSGLNSILESPHNVPVHLLVQVMLVLALANGTYPPNQAPIPQQKAFVWTDLASSVPTTALELNECSLDTLRVAALLNTAKQVLKFNESADYVYSGAGVRLAMMLGLNRAGGVKPDERQLWETTRELDLHACLACGAAPTLPPGTPLDPTPPPPREPSPTGQQQVAVPADGRASVNREEEALSNEALLNILRRSLNTRIRITVLLNTEERLRSEDVMRLSHELAQAMRPVSDAEDDDDSGAHHRWSFAHRYVAFVYHKFLVALHRPFAALRDPAFYLSRDISRHRARAHYRDVVAAFAAADAGGLSSPSSDPFAALLAGNGTLFRVEAVQSALWLSFELYRADGYDAYMPSRSGSLGRDRAAVRELLGRGVVFAERALRTHERAGLAFLVPSLVLRHAAVLRTCAPGSQEYHRAMQDACKGLVDQFSGIMTSNS